MVGIELSEKCFFETFLPEVRKRLPDAEARIAAGLVGGGSECFGFDDEISTDHDFSNGFYVWLTEEDDIKYGVALARIYRECVSPPKAKSASSRTRGIITVEDFYSRYTGRRGLPETSLEWLYIPDHALAEATNGKVFLDNVGEFTLFRNSLALGMPEDVKKKKLAANLLLMAQSGQYNYSRCLAHGEVGASRLALFEFANAAISSVFLLNGKHAPFYKWSLRAMRELSELSHLEAKLTALICTENSQTCASIIEEISSEVAAELRKLMLSSSSSNYLEAHAYEVFDSISDRELRGLHILEK